MSQYSEEDLRAQIKRDQEKLNEVVREKNKQEEERCKKGRAELKAKELKLAEDIEKLKQGFLEGLTEEQRAWYQKAETQKETRALQDVESRIREAYSAGSSSGFSSGKRSERDYGPNPDRGWND